jgi:hypothetical protein
MAHQHRDQLDVAGMAQYLDHLFGRAQGHLAIGQLHTAPGAELGAQQIELRLHIGQGEFGHAIGVGAEVTATTREVVFRHHADGGITAFFLAA